MKCKNYLCIKEDVRSFSDCRRHIGGSGKLLRHKIDVKKEN